jgi:hypothetical protein
VRRDRQDDPRPDTPDGDLVTADNCVEHETRPSRPCP